MEQLAASEMPDGCADPEVLEGFAMETTNGLSGTISLSGLRKLMANDCPGQPTPEHDDVRAFYADPDRALFVHFLTRFDADSAEGQTVNPLFVLAALKARNRGWCGAIRTEGSSECSMPVARPLDYFEGAIQEALAHTGPESAAFAKPHAPSQYDYPFRALNGEQQKKIQRAYALDPDGGPPRPGELAEQVLCEALTIRKLQRDAESDPLKRLDPLEAYLDTMGSDQNALVYHYNRLLKAAEGNTEFALKPVFKSSKNADDHGAAKKNAAAIDPQDSLRLPAKDNPSAIALRTALQAEYTRNSTSGLSGRFRMQHIAPALVPPDPKPELKRVRISAPSSKSGGPSTTTSAPPPNPRLGTYRVLVRRWRIPPRYTDGTVTITSTSEPRVAVRVGTRSWHSQCEDRDSPGTLAPGDTFPELDPNLWESCRAGSCNAADGCRDAGGSSPADFTYPGRGVITAAMLTPSGVFRMWKGPYPDSELLALNEAQLAAEPLTLEMILFSPGLTSTDYILLEAGDITIRPADVPPASPWFCEWVNLGEGQTSDGTAHPFQVLLQVIPPNAPVPLGVDNECGVEP